MNKLITTKIMIALTVIYYLINFNVYIKNAIIIIRNCHSFDEIWVSALPILNFVINYIIFAPPRCPTSTNF